MPRALLSLVVLMLLSCDKPKPSSRGPVAAAEPRASAEHRAAPQTLGPELEGVPYPFAVQRFKLRSQEQALEMAYMDVAADKPNGRVALLFHGKNFQSSYWERTILLLKGRGYRSIAPDQIGFGKSTKPASYQFSLHALAENTRGLLDAVAVPKVTLIGHSMGGMLALRYALMFPESVERLILVNPIGLEDWKTVVPYRSVDKWYADELKATPESIREYQKKNYYDGRWKPEYEPLVATAGAWTRDPSYPKVAWCSALTYDMIFTQPVVYELGNVKVPTLLIVGQRDRTALGRAFAPPDVRDKLGDYPALGKRTASAIPGAKLVEMPNVGHLPQVEAFDEYARALTEFLP